MSDEFGYTALARVALAFVLEDESWPVFLDWAKSNPHSTRLHEWIDATDLDAARDLFLINSPDEDIRRLAGRPA